MGVRLDEDILDELSLTDALAVERTNLAIERTFLAYFRTAVVFASAGFTILKVTMLYSQIKELGFILLIASPLILLIGIVRYVLVYKKLKRKYIRMVERIKQERAK